MHCAIFRVPLGVPLPEGKLMPQPMLLYLQSNLTVQIDNYSQAKQTSKTRRPSSWTVSSSERRRLSIVPRTPQISISNLLIVCTCFEFSSCLTLSFQDHISQFLLQSICVCYHFLPSRCWIIDDLNQSLLASSLDLDLTCPILLLFAIVDLNCV